MSRRLWLASLAASALALAACGKTALFANLDEQQANQVQSTLLAAGIDADKRPADNKKGWTVDVAKDDLPLAMQLLQAKGLPSAPFESMGAVFKKEGFVSSPLEERARYLYAIAQELEHTLQQIDGVVTARVHIALPESDPIGNKENSASAAVVIIEQPGAALADRETDIKAIVTDAVEGLDNINRVTVKFFERDNSELSNALQHGDRGKNHLGVVPVAAAVGVPALLGGIGFVLLARSGLRRRRGAAADREGGAGRA